MITWVDEENHGEIFFWKSSQCELGVNFTRMRDAHTLHLGARLGASSATRTLLMPSHSQRRQKCTASTFTGRLSSLLISRWIPLRTVWGASKPLSR